MAYIHTEIPDELHRQFKAFCAEHGWTMTHVIGNWIQRAVSTEERHDDTDYYAFVMRTQDAAGEEG